MEASVSTPADVGEAIRRNGVTGVFRAQDAVGSWIIGSSYIDTTPYLPEMFAQCVREVDAIAQVLGRSLQPALSRNAAF